MTSTSPNILYIMTDQQRFDTIAALGNSLIYTPNLDRLVERGISFTNAYSTCPVCIPARYTVRTGCEAPTTAIFRNERAQPAADQAESMIGRCGPYLAQRMRERGYRTFGVGKFHSNPWDEDLGYDVHLHSEELYRPDQREQDSYAKWLADNHPEYDFQEGLMGERTEMYYMPQMSHTPAEMGVEFWASQHAAQQIQLENDRPYFGFVSFVGPHPPFAPPIPFNRMYDPDTMGSPAESDIAIDHMDQQIPLMNQLIWAEEINEPWFRITKSRYYGEISYIDWCIGKILDAVEQRMDSDNTLICFFSDHGDHLGDHHGWQKESFFEQSCRIPFLLSWPRELPGTIRRDDLVCLTDLFAIATGASGHTEVRDGIDVLGSISGETSGRDNLTAFHGRPGTAMFKAMVRQAEWKYIFLANGGGEQLFNLDRDSGETSNQADNHPEIVQRMRGIATEKATAAGADALEAGGFKQFPFAKFFGAKNSRGPSGERIYQFDRSRGVSGFPESPSDVMKFFDQKRMEHGN
ncbi:MAG: sulfatase-like hydrolase/transferase [Spirochaetales bacterium]|jgi:arylsulfatase|nr:sulfatase-like hydrolase/transferase [Spirochaetales bacterium]